MGRSAQLFALGAVFAAGWCSSALALRATPVTTAHAAVPGASLASSSDERATCSDGAAMQANANLVEQVHDYRRRLALAEERGTEAEARAARLVVEGSARLSPSREEWARMAREGTVRLRVPCTTWSAGPRFTVSRPTRSGMTVHSGASSRKAENVRRAEVAGLSSEELEALADVYRRTHQRTWAAMKAACEASSEYRESISELDEPSDVTRVAMCRSSMLDVNEPGTRVAIAHVAELRAAGAPIERAANNGERVMFALSDAPESLRAEMVRALGAEKTTRAIDNGVVCFDEALIDLRDRAPDG